MQSELQPSPSIVLPSSHTSGSSSSPLPHGNATPVELDPDEDESTVPLELLSATVVSSTPPLLPPSLLAGEVALVPCSCGTQIPSLHMSPASHPPPGVQSHAIEPTGQPPPEVPLSALLLAVSDGVEHPTKQPAAKKRN